MATKKQTKWASVEEEASRTRQLHRLRRAEGQIRGIQQMLVDGRGCGEITVQIDAVIAALRRVQGEVVRASLSACAEAVVRGERAERELSEHIDELARLFSKSKQ